jgi:hypothetical protein
VPFVGFTLWCDAAYGCRPRVELLVDPGPATAVSSELECAEAGPSTTTRGDPCSPAVPAAEFLNPLTVGLRQTNAHAASRTNVTTDVTEKRWRMITRS